MKLKNTEFKSSLLSIAEASSDGHFHNPGLKYVNFIFCDDKPNENNQGIEYEDFDAVAQSAIGTPIKMRFLGETVGAHIGSIPVGHITDMHENELDDGTHQLIAGGILFANDYPDEIEYLESAFAENKAPGISFEMKYDASLTKPNKDGVSWLKGVLTRAATFVRNPAYGTRTALLALASNNSLSDEDFAEGLSAIANEMRPKNHNEGGNNKVEEELKKIKEELEAVKASLVTANEKITSLETTNASITSEKDELQKKVDTQDTALAALALEKLISERTAAVAEAGITVEADATKLEKKQAFWAGMDEAVFTEYLDDLKAASKSSKGTAFASLRTASASRGIPRLKVEETDESFDGLKGRLGALSRTTVSEEE